MSQEEQDDNRPLDFRLFFETNELSLKIIGKTGHQSVYSNHNFQSGIRGLTYKDIIDLPVVPSLPLKQTDLCILDNCDKRIFFPKQRLNGSYWKGMNPTEYEYVWGISYKVNDSVWCKACYRNIVDDKFAFLTTTNKYVEHNGLTASLHDGWYACKNGMIAPVLFWSCVIDKIRYQYKPTN